MINLTEKLIILDRDGVINYDSVDYIKSPDEWIPIPKSLEAIAKLNQAGFRVAVATNQSGVGRGYYTEETLTAIHQKMQDLLAKENGHIDAIFYCPHLPTNNCKCRKPNPGLLHQIAKHYQCSLINIPFVGDSQCDIDAALAVGATPLHITEIPDAQSSYSCFKDLHTAVNAILNINNGASVE